VVYLNGLGFKRQCRKQFRDGTPPMPLQAVSVRVRRQAQLRKRCGKCGDRKVRNEFNFRKGLLLWSLRRRSLREVGMQLLRGQFANGRILLLIDTSLMIACKLGCVGNCLHLLSSIFRFTLCQNAFLPVG